MKTTIDIADDLLDRAKSQAKRENKTLKQIVEEALRRQLASAPPKNRYQYRPITFRGKGLRPGLSEGDWETIRDMAYGMDERRKSTGRSPQ